MKDRLRKFARWIAETDEAELRRRASRHFVWFLRYCWMLGEQFVHDRCMQKAAALTYTAILSLFPLLAVISIFIARFHEGGPEKVEEKEPVPVGV